MKQRDMLIKITAAAALLVLAIMSFAVFGNRATDAASYSHTIEAIDEKKGTVMAVTATAAAASTAIAGIPGDASSPIANQIMEISEYLFLVVCFLVLEKSLLTVMGFLGFKVLIPLAFVFGAVYVFWKKPELKMLALKFLVFGAMIVSIIPFSVYISDMIYEVNQSSIEQLKQDYASEPKESIATEETVPAEEEDKSFWESFSEGIKETVNDVTEKVENTVTNTVDDAKAVLNRFVDAIALFVISYCAIPVIVVLVFVWFMKFLFQIPVPDVKIKPRHKRLKKAEEELQLMNS